jgi:hypothetical protein
MPKDMLHVVIEAIVERWPGLSAVLCFVLLLHSLTRLLLAAEVANIDIDDLTI